MAALTISLIIPRIRSEWLLPARPAGAAQSKRATDRVRFGLESAVGPVW